LENQKNKLKKERERERERERENKKGRGRKEDGIKQGEEKGGGGHPLGGFLPCYFKLHIF
jgi:hypothetical protein